MKYALEVVLRAATVALLFLAGCSDRDDGPSPGDGDHVITGISVVVVRPDQQWSFDNPVEMKTGESLEIRVKASWAIPSVTDISGDARLTLMTPDMGELDRDSKFHAKKSGEAKLQATYRGFTHTLILVVSE
jgi:hypothetical protein